MKSEKWWTAATGNRLKGRLKKVTIEQFVSWTKNWDTFNKAPDFYHFVAGRIVQTVTGRAFCRLYYEAYHRFGTPAHLLRPVKTLYYDDTNEILSTTKK